MSIRIKEWGMQHAPSSTVRIPVEGLHGWVDATERLGSGMVHAVLGADQLLQAEKQITAGGELAAFSEQLHRIGNETAAELADKTPQDWDYAWQAASTPRIAEAVAALPPEARPAAQELAEAFNAQASLRAQRDQKVQAIEQARRHWQQRVDEAVETGDAQRAEQWLQSGAGIFVPQQELEQRKQQAGSNACKMRWLKAVQADATQALADYLAATPEQLPETKEDNTALAEHMQQQRQTCRMELAQSFLQGKTHPHEELQKALAAGILTQSEYEQACTTPRKLSPAEQIDWMRRMDECSDDEPEKINLQMALGTAPMDAQTRRHMLTRARLAEKIPTEDRRALSRRLLHLYATGGFGCPQDAEAQQRLCSLQRAGLPLLAEQGSEAAAEWLQSISAPCDAWVCFSDFA
ncbi:MAG: hypothetical protein IJ993_05510 [Akkermansia sp.]|nr:hypothetical protein [Akkermansia sp.]